MKFAGVFITLFALLLLGGCGGGGGGSDSTTTEEDVTVVAVDAIQMTADSTTVKTGAALDIDVALFSVSGQPITEETSVAFSLNTPALGSIDSSVVVQGGSAVVRFVARDIEGEVIVTATSGEVTSTLTIQISNQVEVGSVVVVANPAELIVGGTSVVSATILDVNGEDVPDGTAVSFSLNNSQLGTVVQNTTTQNSIAKATFSAADDYAGTATITVTSGAVTGSCSIVVVGAAAGSIEYDVTATPQIVALKGSGGVETTTVTFLVQDANGNPVIGSQTVKLELSGPNGGEYIGTVPGNLTIEVGTVDGAASTTIHSGIIPGTATVTATVLDNDGNETSLKTSSGVIAIGGGVPSAGHFSFSVSQKNLAGLEYDGLTLEISARIADRYGNYNVLEGTTVSFYAESGAIDRAINLNASGEGTVTFRTQNPLPYDVDLVDDSNRVWCNYEKEKMDDYEEAFNVVTTELSGMGNPRDGLCTIIAVVDGEEEFTDANADGLYSYGESYTDSYDDIHLDMDDDRTDLSSSEVKSGVPHDPTFEDLIVDRNQDGSFDGRNNKWDDNKRIAEQLRILITGSPYIDIARKGASINNGETVEVTQGSSTVFYYSVHDINYNSLIGGSSISVSADAGTLSGNKSVDIVDTNIPGPTVYQVTLTDDDEDSTAPGATLEVSVDWNGTTYTKIVPIEFVD